MTNRYCLIDESTSVCVNVVLWDGNLDTWSPPVGYIALPQETTPSKVWAWNTGLGDWSLVPSEPIGWTGFTWDGTYLIAPRP
jgi:hypothetical protein